MNEPAAAFLAAEYQAALQRLHLIDDRLLLAGAGGSLLSVGAAAYTLGFRSELELKLGYAWAAPLPFLATAAVLLALLGWRLATSARLAALRQGSGLPPHGSRPPVLFLHRLLILPGAGLGILYLLTFLYALRAIYTASRVAGTGFALVYLALSAALAVAAWAVWRMARGAPPLESDEVRRLFLPFPGDFLAGFGLFLAGWAAPWLTTGLNVAQLGPINALFRRGEDFTAQVPVAAVAALGLAVFLVIEGLLVPAGGLWQVRLAGLKRGVNQLGYTQILLRWALAFPLAYFLGGAPLALLAALIWLQAVVSELIPGRNTPASNRFRLLWGALLAPLRFSAGALAWLGPAWSFTWLLLLFCAVAFLSVGLRAAGQARQARLELVRGGAERPYDLRNAPRWQHAGFLAAGLTLVALLVLQLLAETRGFFNAYLAAGYGYLKNSGVHYAQAGAYLGLLLTLDLLLLGLLACALLVRLLARGGPGWTVAAGRLRMPGMIAGLVAALGLGLAALVTGLFSLALGGLLAGTLAAALWAER